MKNEPKIQTSYFQMYENTEYTVYSKHSNFLLIFLYVAKSFEQHTG